MIQDTTVVLRNCGERTIAEAARLIAPLVPADAFHRVSAVPFSKCLHESLRIGLEQHRPWTLCIDADVLVEARGIVNLREAALAAPTCVVELQGVVFDKFFNIERPAGNHLYRTSLLERMMAAIPPEGTSLRPETDAMNVLRSQGHPWLQTRDLVGLHDFEQYYRDIYRKCFVQAHKHREFLEYPKQYWLAMESADPDFLLATLAIADGVKAARAPAISKEFMDPTAIEDRMAAIGLCEKEPLLGPLQTAKLISKVKAGIPASLQRDRRRFRKTMHEMFFGRRPTLKSRLIGMLTPSNRSDG
jgi:hypothetical protein